MLSLFADDEHQLNMLVLAGSEDVDVKLIHTEYDHGTADEKFCVGRRSQLFVEFKDGFRARLYEFAPLNFVFEIVGFVATLEKLNCEQLYVPLA